MIQYQNPTDNTPYSGAVLKAYAAGTTTNILMATDSGGGTTFTSVALNASGYPEHSGSIVIPHIDQNYKLALYADQAAADADTPAIWSIDDNIPVNITNDFSLEDNVSNAISVVSDFTHTTTGTPVAGMGTGVGFITETVAGNERGMVIGSRFSDVGAGTEDANFVVQLMVNGAAVADKLVLDEAGSLVVATLSPTNALAVAKGGTGATDASTARTNLGAQAALSIPSQAEAEAGVATTARSFTAERVKQAIDALGGVGRDYLEGLVISRDSGDTARDTNVTAGVAIDSTNSVTMTLASEITKQIDATWASGDDAGGLASGATLANTTWYHVFLVVVGGSVDVMLDTSVTCANGVANNAVTSFRRINSVLTDGSSNIVSYYQVGDYTYWDVPVADVSASNPGTSAVTATLSVPTGVVVQSDINISGTEVGAPITLLVTSLAQTDTTPSNSQFDVSENTTGVIGYAVNRPVMTNTSAQVRYRVAASTANTSVIIFTKGWWRI
tara:strand:+ start:12708 stop:14210 length:1503 start_codon:yes stop_codon:yes gene_type:complete